MRKLFLYLFIGILCLPACTPPRGDTPTPTPRQRISLEDACARITALLPEQELELREITTDTLWDEMGVQLFTNVSREQYEYVFALAGDTALELKELWGSYYFDYTLADMDGDGQKEMLYTYDWGSGIVRSVLGILKADGSQVEIAHTKEAEGLWTFRNLQAGDNAVTCEAQSLGGGPARKGICTYKDDAYIFDI